MRHVVGATKTVTRLRMTVACYRHTQAIVHDGQFVSSDSSSHDRSPCAAPDEHEAPLASSSHHGDEAGPLATSSHQRPAASINTSHDHEQAGTSNVEATPLIEHASTSISYIDVVLPPADPCISTSHDHE